MLVLDGLQEELSPGSLLVGRPPESPPLSHLERQLPPQAPGGLHTVVRAIDAGSRFVRSGMVGDWGADVSGWDVLDYWGGNKERNYGTYSGWYDGFMNPKAYKSDSWYNWGWLKYGPHNWDPMDAAALGIEVLADPLTYALGGFGHFTKAGRSLQKLKKIEKRMQNTGVIHMKKVRKAEVGEKTIGRSIPKGRRPVEGKPGYYYVQKAGKETGKIRRGRIDKTVKGLVDEAAGLKNSILADFAQATEIRRTLEAAGKGKWLGNSAPNVDQILAGGYKGTKSKWYGETAEDMLENWWATRKDKLVDKGWGEHLMGGFWEAAKGGFKRGKGAGKSVTAMADVSKRAYLGVREALKREGTVVKRIFTGEVSRAKSALSLGLPTLHGPGMQALITRPLAQVSRLITWPVGLGGHMPYLRAFDRILKKYIGKSYSGAFQKAFFENSIKIFGKEIPTEFNVLTTVLKSTGANIPGWLWGKLGGSVGTGKVAEAAEHLLLRLLRGMIVTTVKPAAKLAWSPFKAVGITGKAAARGLGILPKKGLVQNAEVRALMETYQYLSNKGIIKSQEYMDNFEEMVVEALSPEQWEKMVMQVAETQDVPAKKELISALKSNDRERIVELVGFDPKKGLTAESLNQLLESTIGGKPFTEKQLLRGDHIIDHLKQYMIKEHGADFGTASGEGTEALLVSGKRVRKELTAEKGLSKVNKARYDKLITRRINLAKMVQDAEDLAKDNPFGGGGTLSTPKSRKILKEMKDDLKGVNKEIRELEDIGRERIAVSGETIQQQPRGQERAAHVLEETIEINPELAKKADEHVAEWQRIMKNKGFNELYNKLDPEMQKVAYRLYITPILMDEASRGWATMFRNEMKHMASREVLHGLGSFYGFGKHIGDELKEFQLTEEIISINGKKTTLEAAIKILGNPKNTTKRAVVFRRKWQKLKASDGSYDVKSLINKNQRLGRITNERELIEFANDIGATGADLWPIDNWLGGLVAYFPRMLRKDVRLWMEKYPELLSAFLEGTKTAFKELDPQSAKFANMRVIRDAFTNEITFLDVVTKLTHTAEDFFSRMLERSSTGRLKFKGMDKDILVPQGLLDGPLFEMDPFMAMAQRHMASEMAVNTSLMIQSAVHMWAKPVMKRTGKAINLEDAVSRFGTPRATQGNRRSGQAAAQYEKNVNKKVQELAGEEQTGEFREPTRGDFTTDDAHMDEGDKAWYELQYERAQRGDLEHELEDPFTRGAQAKGFSDLVYEPNWLDSHHVNAWKTFGQALQGNGTHQIDLGDGRKIQAQKHLTEPQEAKLREFGLGEIGEDGFKMIPSVKDFKAISPQHKAFYEDLENSAVVQNGVIREGALSIMRMFFKKTAGSEMLNFARSKGMGRSILWDILPENSRLWGRTVRLRKPKMDALAQAVDPESAAQIGVDIQRHLTPGEIQGARQSLVPPTDILNPLREADRVGAVDIGGKTFFNKPWEEMGSKIALSPELQHTPIGFQVQVMMHEIGHVLFQQTGHKFGNIRSMFSNYLANYMGHQGSIKSLVRSYFGVYGKNVTAAWEGQTFEKFLDDYASEIQKRPEEVFAVLFANSFMRKKIPLELMLEPPAGRPLMRVARQFFKKFGSMVDEQYDRIKSIWPSQSAGEPNGWAMRRGTKAWRKRIMRLRHQYENEMIRIESRGKKADGGWWWTKAEKNRINKIADEADKLEKELTEWDAARWRKIKFSGDESPKGAMHTVDNEGDKIYNAIGEEGMYMVQYLDTLFDTAAGLEGSMDNFIKVARKRRASQFYSDYNYGEYKRAAPPKGRKAEEVVVDEMRRKWMSTVRRHDQLRQAVVLLKHQRIEEVNLMKGIDDLSKQMEVRRHIVENIDRRIFQIENKLQHFDAFKDEYAVLMAEDDPLKLILDDWKLELPVKGPEKALTGPKKAALLRELRYNNLSLQEVPGDERAFYADLYAPADKRSHYFNVENPFESETLRPSAAGPVQKMTMRDVGISALEADNKIAATEAEALRGQHRERVGLPSEDVKYRAPGDETVSTAEGAAIPTEVKPGKRYRHPVTGEEEAIVGTPAGKTRKMKKLKTLEKMLKKRIEEMKGKFKERDGPIVTAERRGNRHGIVEDDVTNLDLLGKVDKEKYGTVDGEALEAHDVAHAMKGKVLLDEVDEIFGASEDAGEEFTQFMARSHFPNDKVTSSAHYRMKTPDARLELKFDTIDVDNLMRYMQSDLIEKERGVMALRESFPEWDPVNGNMDFSSAGELRKWFLSIFEMIHENGIDAGILRNKALQKVQRNPKTLLPDEVSKKRAAGFSAVKIPEKFWQIFEYLTSARPSGSSPGGDIQSLNKWLQGYIDAQPHTFEPMVEALNKTRHAQHGANKEMMYTLGRNDPLPTLQDYQSGKRGGLKWHHLSDNHKMYMIDEYLIDQNVNPAWIKSFILSRVGDPKWKLLAGELVEPSSYMWGPDSTLLKVQDFSHTSPLKKTRVPAMPEEMKGVPGNVQSQFDASYTNVMRFLEMARDRVGHTPKRFVSSDESFALRGYRDAKGEVLPERGEERAIGESPDIVMREAEEHGANQVLAQGPTGMEAQNAGWAQLDVLPHGEAPFPFHDASPPPLFPKPHPSQSGALHRTRAAQEALEEEAIAMRQDVRNFLTKLQRQNLRGPLEPGEITPFEKKLQQFLEDEDSMWEIVEQSTPDKILSDGTGAGWTALDTALELGIERGGAVNRKRFAASGKGKAESGKHNLVDQSDGAIQGVVADADFVLVVTRGVDRSKAGGLSAGIAVQPLASLEPGLVVYSGGQGGIDMMASMAAHATEGIETRGTSAFQGVYGHVTGIKAGRRQWAKGDKVAWSPQYGQPGAQYGSKKAALKKHGEMGIHTRNTLDPRPPPKGSPARKHFDRGRKQDMGYNERTIMNIVDTDGTVVVFRNKEHMGEAGSGSVNTYNAAKHGDLSKIWGARSDVGFLYSKPLNDKTGKLHIDHHIDFSDPDQVKRPVLAIFLDDDTGDNLFKMRKFAQGKAKVNFAGPNAHGLLDITKGKMETGDTWWRAQNLFEDFFGIERTGGTVSAVTQRPVASSPNLPSVAVGVPKKSFAMNYGYGQTVRGTKVPANPQGMAHTFEAIKEGHRTATTRPLKQVQGLVQGDQVEFVRTVGGKKETITVELTSDPRPTAPMTADEWSRPEGYEPDEKFFKLYSTNKKANYHQFEYKVVMEDTFTPSSKPIKTDGWYKFNWTWNGKPVTGEIHISGGKVVETRGSMAAKRMGPGGDWKTGYTVKRANDWIFDKTHENVTITPRSADHAYKKADTVQNPETNVLLTDAMMTPDGIRGRKRIFVFGDNVKAAKAALGGKPHKPGKGQAAIRQETNALGISTSLDASPNSGFMSDDFLEANKARIDAEIQIILDRQDALKHPVVFPVNSKGQLTIGAGLSGPNESGMWSVAPRTYEYLLNQIRSRFKIAAHGVGEDFIEPTISKASASGPSVVVGGQGTYGIRLVGDKDGLIQGEVTLRADMTVESVTGNLRNWSKQSFSPLAPGKSWASAKKFFGDMFERNLEKQEGRTSWIVDRAQTAQKKDLQSAGRRETEFIDGDGYPQQGSAESGPAEGAIGDTTQPAPPQSGIVVGVSDELRPYKGRYADNKIRKDHGEGNVFSGSRYDPLLMRLTNPTDRSIGKGLDLSHLPTGDYEIQFANRQGQMQPWTNVEDAYQKLKNNNATDYDLMVKLITQKFKSYPELVMQVNERGGANWIRKLVHHVSANYDKAHARWMGGFKTPKGEGWMIKTLHEAYEAAIKDDAIAAMLREAPAPKGKVKKLSAKAKKVQKANEEAVVEQKQWDDMTADERSSFLEGRGRAYGGVDYDELIIRGPGDEDPIRKAYQDLETLTLMVPGLDDLLTEMSERGASWDEINKAVKQFLRGKETPQQYNYESWETAAKSVVKAEKAAERQAREAAERTYDEGHVPEKRDVAADKREGARREVEEGEARAPDRRDPREIKAEEDRRAAREIGEAEMEDFPRYFAKRTAGPGHTIDDADSQIITNLSLERDGGGFARTAKKAAEFAWRDGKPVMHVQMTKGMDSVATADAVQMFLNNKVRGGAKKVAIIGEEADDLGRGALGGDWEGRLKDIMRQLWGEGTGAERLKEEFTSLQHRIMGRTSSPSFKEEARQFFIRLRAQDLRNAPMVDEMKELYGKLQKLFPGYDAKELPPLPNWSPRQEAEAFRLLSGTDPDRFLAPVSEYGTARPELAQGLREWGGLRGTGPLAGPVAMPRASLPGGEKWYPSMGESRLLARTLSIPEMGFPKSEAQIQELLENMTSDSEFRYLMGQVADLSEDFISPGAGSHVPIGSSEHKMASMMAPERLNRGLSNDDIAKIRGVASETWDEGATPFERQHHVRDPDPRNVEEWWAAQQGYATLSDVPAEQIVRAPFEGGNTKKWFRDMAGNKPDEFTDQEWMEGLEEIRDRMLEFRVNPVTARLLEPGRFKGGEGLLQRGTWRMRKGAEGVDDVPMSEKSIGFEELHEAAGVPGGYTGTGMTANQRRIAAREAAAAGPDPAQRESFRGAFTDKGARLGRQIHPNQWDYAKPGALSDPDFKFDDAYLADWARESFDTRGMTPKQVENLNQLKDNREGLMFGMEEQPHLNYDKAREVMENLPKAFGNKIQSAKQLADLYVYVINNSRWMPNDFFQYMLREMQSHKHWKDMFREYKIVGGPVGEPAVGLIQRGMTGTEADMAVRQSIESAHTSADSAVRPPILKYSGKFKKEKLPQDQFEGLWWDPQLHELPTPSMGKEGKGIEQFTTEALARGEAGEAIQASKEAGKEVQQWLTKNGKDIEWLRNSGDMEEILEAIYDVVNIDEVAQANIASAGAQRMGAPTQKIAVYKETGLPVYALDPMSPDGLMHGPDGSLVYANSQQYREMDQLYVGRSGKAIESQPGMAADEYNPIYTVADAEKKELTQESLMKHGYEKGDDLSPVPTAEQGSNVLPNASGHPSKSALESAQTPTLGNDIKVRMVKKSPGERAMSEINEVLKTGQLAGVEVSEELYQKALSFAKGRLPPKPKQTAWPQTKIQEGSMAPGVVSGEAQQFPVPPELAGPRGPLLSKTTPDGDEVALLTSGANDPAVKKLAVEIREHVMEGGEPRTTQSALGMHDKQVAMDKEALRFHNLPSDGQEQYITGLARKISEEGGGGTNHLTMEMEEHLRRRLMNVDTMMDPETGLEVSARGMTKGDGSVPWYDNRVWPDTDELKSLRDVTDLRAFPEERRASKSLSQRGRGDINEKWPKEGGAAEPDDVAVGRRNSKVLNRILGDEGSPHQLGPENEIRYNKKTKQLGRTGEGVWDEGEEFWMEAPEGMPKEYMSLARFAHESGMVNLEHPLTGQMVPVGDTLAKTRTIFSQYGLKDYAMPMGVAAHLLEGTQKMATSQNFKNFIKAWSKTTAISKAALTQMFPAFYVRNLFSDSMLSWISGAFDPATFRDAFRMALDTNAELKSVGKKPDGTTWTAKDLALEAKAGGAYAGGKSHQMIAELQNEAMTTDFGRAVQNLNKRKGWFRNPNSLFNKIMTFKWIWGHAVPKEYREIVKQMDFRQLTQLMERYTRSQHILARMRKGDSYLGAIEHARVHLLDYSDLTQAEKIFAQNTIMFYSWTRKILPRLWDNFFKYPGRSAAAMRISLHPSEKREGILPDWLRETGAIQTAGGFLHGLGSPFEELYKLDWTFGTTKPPENMGDFLSQVMKGGGKIARKLTSQFHPVFKAGVELIADKDTFSQRQIGELDQVGSEWWMMKKVFGTLGMDSLTPKTKELPGGMKRHTLNPYVNYLKNSAPWGRFIKEYGGTVPAILSSAFGDGQIDPKKTAGQNLLRFLTGVKFSPRGELESLWSKEQYVTELMNNMIQEGYAGKIPIYFPLGRDSMDKSHRKQIDLYLDMLKALGRRKKEIRGARRSGGRRTYQRKRR